MLVLHLQLSHEHQGYQREDPFCSFSGGLFCSSVILDTCPTSPGAWWTSVGLKTRNANHRRKSLHHQQMWNQHRRGETWRVRSPDRSPNNQSHKLQIRWNSLWNTSFPYTMAPQLPVFWLAGRCSLLSTYLILKAESWWLQPTAPPAGWRSEVTVIPQFKVFYSALLQLRTTRCHDTWAKSCHLILVNYEWRLRL